MRKPLGWIGFALTWLIFCIPATAQTNLALNKPTQMSSVYSAEFAGAMCVDGNKGNFCHSKQELNPWWQVDLQDSYSISEIVVTNRSGYGERSRTINALLSSDGQNWQRIYTHNEPNFATLHIPVGNRTARFVRLQLAANEYLNLSEVEVNGQSSGSSDSSHNPNSTLVAALGNLALNKPTQMSSVYSAEFAGAMCVDGNKGNFCHSKQELNPWWQVDLQDSYSISEIVVTNRSGYGERSRTISALLSSDGQNWQRIYTHNEPNFAALHIPVGNRAARFVRLQLAANEYLNLSEVEVNGQSSGSSGTATKKSEAGPGMTFGNAGGVTVTVPDGLIARNSTLTAVPSKTAAQLPKPSTAAKILGAYDISLGNTSEFDHEIQIAIPYDPSTLDPNVPEGKNLWVSSWDSTRKLWSLQRAEVDTARKRLLIRTTHLSTWAYWTLQGYKYVESSEKVMPRPNVFYPTAPLPAAALVVYYNPGDAQPRTDGVPASYNMKNLADDTLAALIQARTAYQDARFEPLDYQVNAIITDAGVSNMDVYTGNVFLDRKTLTTLALLRHDSGHELFHVVQNQYFNIVGMDRRRWWIEGTPDYASAAVWKEVPTPPLDVNYFDDSLFLNENVHAYQNSQFIHYLVSQRNLNFKAMWDAVVAQSGTGDNGAAVFQNYVSGVIGNSFASVWADFVDYAMFGTHPLDRAITSTIAIPDAFTTDSTSVTVPSSAAKGVFIRPKISIGKPAARIKLSVANLGDGATVEIWKVQLEGKGVPNRRTGRLGHVLVEGNAESPAFELNSQNGLEAIVINPGLMERSFTITAKAVSGPIVTLTPSKIENAENKIYNFSVKLDGLASTIAKVECEWDFSDGSDLVSFSAKPLKAQHESQVSHRFNKQDADLKVKVKIYDRTLGRVLLAEAAAQVSFAKPVLKTVKVSTTEEIAGYFQGEQLIKRHGITRFSQSDGTFVETEYQDGKKVHSKIYNEENHRLIVEKWYRGDDEFEYQETTYSWDGKPEFEKRRLDKNSKWQIKTSTGEWF